MSETVWWAIVAGVGLGMGLWMLVSMLPRLDRPRLERRLAPYLLDVSEGARASIAPPPAGPLAVLGLVAYPIVAPLRTVARAIGGTTALVATRVRQAALGMTVEAYRLQQLTCAALGGLAGLGLTLSMHGGAVLWLTGAVGGAIGGVALRDALLARRVRRRLARLTAELPVILEFLALSLSAGEGVLDALRRVARTGRGELAAELRDAVAAVGAGVPLPEALARLDRELGLPPLSRALEQLIGALERGAPLGEVLRAQAQDARDGTRRALLESAGRKEIAMLVPSTMVKTPYLAVGRSAALQLVPLVSRSGSLVLSGGPSLPVVTTH